MIATTHRFGPYRLTPAERVLERDGRPLVMGSRALDLLILLVERAGEVVSRRDLMDRVWPDMIVEDVSLRVSVAGLRKALGDGVDGARYIVNVPGRGYCFVAPVAQITTRPAPIAAPRAMTPLPPRLSRMVGRDLTVANLADRLRQRRFVSIVGPGGMGKTTVAVAVAHQLADAFGGQVAFVDLTPLADSALVIATIAAAIGATPSELDPLAGLLTFVAERRMLVVLDNCEHLVDAVAMLVEQLCRRAPELHLLVTSREALRTQGEHIHVLEALEGPTPDLKASASELMQYPAVQLFMERAADGGYREPLDEATAPLVARMCHHLDGIPLAIELAAGRLGTHGVQGTAELLDNRFKLLLQGRRRSALPRHNTLHAMLDWSFNLLSERDRTILTRLGVFGGVFSLAAVRAVAGFGEYDVLDAEQALDSLVEKSLVWTLEWMGSTLYRLPHVTREFALAELAKRDDSREVARRHAGCVLNLQNVLGGAHDRLGALHFARRLPCLRAALKWSFSEDGDRELAVDLVVSAAPLWRRTGWLGECRHWSERALGQLGDGDKGGVKELALQEALAVSAMFTRGNDGVVDAAIERGLALAETLGQACSHLNLLAGRHIFLTRIGAFDESLTVALRALEIANGLSDGEAQVMAEWMVGTSYHLVGLQEDAQRHCDRGFALASANGCLDIKTFGFDHYVRMLIVMARCAWLRGRWDQGMAFGRKAIEQAEGGDSPVGLCIALIYAATVLLWHGAFHEAGSVIARLEDHADQHALGPYRAVAFALRGELIGALGQYEEATEVLHGALARLHQENHWLMAPRASQALANSLMHAGDLGQARTAIDGAIDRAARSGGNFDLAELLRTQAEIQSRAGDADGAEAILLKAIAIADEQGAISWQLKSGEALARLRMSLGRAGEAQAVLSALLALLDACAPEAAVATTRDRLLALRIEAGRSAAAPLDVAE
jgi:predicted ATPase/DNA-binding winged helix-turn-helix (wHTH) protein